MKFLYLTFSLLLTAFILILAFGNVGASCQQMHFFFYPINLNPTFLILSIAVIGIITGAFYHSFLSRVLKTTDDEADEL